MEESIDSIEEKSSVENGTTSPKPQPPKRSISRTWIKLNVGGKVGVNLVIFMLF